MPMRSQSVTAREIARDLSAVILLAGQVGRNPFSDGVQRSTLDLPAYENRTVLKVWADQLEALAQALDLTRLRVLISVDQAGRLPTVPETAGSRIQPEIVRDPGEYRGTAGVVKDLSRDFGQSDWLLVAAANQIHQEPLAEVFEALCEGGESVSIVPSGGSEIAGMFLLRCARLRDVPDVGFVDLKEQAIPSARGHTPLHVSRRPPGSTLPIRTLAEYVRALRVIHAPAAADDVRVVTEDPYAETWKPVFSIVEPGAHVAQGAVLQDSVVLAGGRVEAGAAVARSVVCPTGVVRRGQCIVESMVPGSK